MEGERDIVYMCVRKGERDIVYMCVREGERQRESERERERERVRERKKNFCIRTDNLDIAFFLIIYDSFV